MSKVQIRFSPEIFRRLGEELHPYPDEGVIELVKNAYDADARTCTISIVNADKPGGAVIIKDDGDGMDEDEILNGWLVLGRSGKAGKTKTRLGRIPAGSKGLGRLAALRLGSRAMLSTKPREAPGKRYDLMIDWDLFERAETVDKISLSIESGMRDRSDASGTEIVIENLRTHITRMELKRLARRLILLADPFGDDPSGFKPNLVAPEFADIEKLVQSRYFDDAEYHLTASVDKGGRAQGRVLDWKGKELFSATHEELAVERKEARYCCPKAEFHLWVFILDGATFSTRSSALRDVKQWLAEFGGVHLYQNELRVSPYGDPSNDWLELNLRRVKSPEERPGTNTVIGRVVVHDKEELLIQKTDRTGFIETEAFLELREFALDTLEWMAKRRMELAQKRRAKERAAALEEAKPSKKNLDAAIEQAPAQLQPALRKAAEAHEHAHLADKDRLRKEIQLYRTLSTAGITAATFAHESSSSPIKVIWQSIRAIERRTKDHFRANYSKLLERPVQSIIRSIESLAVLGAATLKLLDHEKRRTSRVDLHAVIKDVLKTFEPFTRGRDVEVLVEFSRGAPYLRASEAAIESIVTNLLNNCVAAFESGHVKQRLIRIRTEVEAQIFRLRVEDNGPGITGISKRDIWLPGMTTRKTGTGLGLAIVKDTVDDLGGSVAAVERSPDLGGAEITVELPIIGS